MPAKKTKAATTKKTTPKASTKAAAPAKTAASVDGLQARVQDLETTNLTLIANVDELVAANKALKDELKKATDDLGKAQAQAAKQAKADPAKPAQVFDIPVHEGILVVSDTKLPNEEWLRKGQASGHWIVDYEGPSAEYLSKRTSHTYRKEQLVDGVWRVFVPNQLVAQTLQTEGRRLIEVNHDFTATITIAPSKTSVTRLKDDCRGTGVGLSASLGAVGALLPPEEKDSSSQRTWPVELHTDKDGNPAALVIPLK